MSDQDEPIARPAGFFVLTLAGDHIEAITRFHLDDLYPRLGFPASTAL
jgi:RNA polymerase sigma-70 factor (ECF subfamily)